MRYAIMIQKDENSDFGVIVLDLPGCFSAGNTIEEAVENSKEAILCHLEGMLDDNEDIPTPMAVEQHYLQAQHQGILAFVDIDLSEIAGKTKRIDITLPQKLIKKIDKSANELGLSRSAYIAEMAAMNVLKKDHIHQDRI